MAIDKERICNLLGSGLSTEIVATAVGCDPSYVSQLLANEEFANKVSTLRSAALMADSARDRSIGALEDKLVARLTDVVDSGLIFKPRDLLAAFAVVNRAQRRGVSAPQSTVVNNHIVNLQLPTAARRQFTLNNTSEVIEVEGQTLVTMTAAQLMRKMSSKSEDPTIENKYDRVARYIPPSREQG